MRIKNVRIKILFLGMGFLCFLFLTRNCVVGDIENVLMIDSDGKIMNEIPAKNIQDIINLSMSENNDIPTNDPYETTIEGMIQDSDIRTSKSLEDAKNAEVNSEYGHLLLIPNVSDTESDFFMIDTAYFPIPLNQLSFEKDLGPGSCNGWAGVYYLKSYQEAREAHHKFSRDKPSKLDEKFIHHPIDFKEIHDFDFTNGSQATKVMSVLQRYGAPTLSDKKKDKKAALKSSISYYPTIYSPKLSAALNKKLKKYQKPNHMKSILKGFLKREYPLVAEINGFEDNLPDGIVKGKHAVLLTGFNKANVIYLNSFGREWEGAVIKGSGIGEISFDKLFEKADRIILPLDNKVKRGLNLSPFYNLIYNGGTNSYIFNDNKTPISLLDNELHELSNRSVAEILKQDSIVVYLKDSRRDYLFELHQNFPLISEYGKIDFSKEKINLVGICSKLDLNKGLRTWGKLSSNYDDKNSDLIVFYTLLDSNNRDIGTIEHTVKIMNNKFDSTIPISANVALSQVASIRLDNVKYSSLSDQYSLCLKEELIKNNLDSILTITKYEKNEYIGVLNELKALINN